MDSFHLQGQRESQASNQELFDSEDEAARSYETSVNFQ
jgi:hypothetical protein